MTSRVKYLFLYQDLDTKEETNGTGTYPIILLDSILPNPVFVVF